jgi:arylsulfatase A-like enzyme
MRPSTYVLASVVLLLAASGCTQEKQPSAIDLKGEAPPNIVFVLMDALRADCVTAQRQGNPIMPGLKRLAEQEAFFVPRAVTPCTWTKPAMASLFTSLYFDTHQVRYDFSVVDGKKLTDALAAEFETMAEVFKASGYNTLCVQTNPHLSRGLGFAQGFDEYVVKDGTTPADAVTDAALGLVEHARSPFLLYVHYMDTHVPYDPPPAHIHAVGGAPEILEEDRPAIDDFVAYLMDWGYYTYGIKKERKFRDLSEQGKEVVRAQYYGAAHFLDEHVLRLVEAVQRSHSNTYFALTADHGEELWEHGGMGHGLTLYSEVLDVPFLLMGPGIEVQTVGKPVQTLGLLPTLTSCAGITPRALWQGVDLRDQPTTPAFSRTMASQPRLGVDEAAVIEAPFKLIARHGLRVFELYRFDQDRGDTRDIAGALPAEGLRLKSLLEKHLAAARRVVDLQEGQGKAQISEELSEQLRAMGYFGD